MLLQGVDGREDGASQLVVATQQPVGESQELASGFAPERGEQQGTANEDQCCVASEPQGRHEPPDEIESEGQREAEHEAQWACVVEMHWVASNPPEVPGQHEGREAEEAKYPGAGRQVPRRRQLAVHNEASEQEPHDEAHSSADRSNVAVMASRLGVGDAGYRLWAGFPHTVGKSGHKTCWVFDHSFFLLVVHSYSLGHLLFSHSTYRLVDTDAVITLQQHWRKNEHHIHHTGNYKTNTIGSSRNKLPD